MSFRMTYLILCLTDPKVITIRLYVCSASCCRVRKVRVARSDFSSKSHQSFRVHRNP
jgi:hypothetical protein